MLVRNAVLSAPDEALPDGTPIILWDNRVTINNVTATSADVNYPATNLANPATNQEWRGASDSPTPTEVDIDVSVDSVELIDGVGIARHNFGTSGVSVTILSVSTDSPPVETILAGPQIPPDDEPMLFHFTERAFSTLRIRLGVPASTVPRAAVLYVGPLLILERGVDVGSDFTPPHFARKTDIVNGMSHGGDFLGRVVTSRYIADSVMTFKHFTPTWYRTAFDPFIESAQTDYPFFIAWAPDNYVYEVAYCWLTEDPVPTVSPITGRMNVSIKMGGILA